MNYDPFNYHVNCRCTLISAEPTPRPYKHFPENELHALMEKAIDNEHYEQCAEIRDEIVARTTISYDNLDLSQ